ncbi:hypothetical protein [Rhodohalobacter sp. SW132]|nr:hypothetical protein [Rhodohalobacter sp. SW132]
MNITHIDTLSNRVSDSFFEVISANILFRWSMKAFMKSRVGDRGSGS